MLEFSEEKGITLHSPHTPSLNGLAERMNRTILVKARTHLSESGIENKFWGDAVLTSIYLINIMPTRALKILKTQYEMWHKKKPDLQFLKVFGSKGHVLTCWCRSRLLCLGPVPRPPEAGRAFIDQSQLQDKTERTNCLVLDKRTSSGKTPVHRTLPRTHGTGKRLLEDTVLFVGSNSITITETEPVQVL